MLLSSCVGLGNCSNDKSNVYWTSLQASMDLAPFFFFSFWDYLDVVGAEAWWLPLHTSFYNVFPPLLIPSSCLYYGLISSFLDLANKIGETVREKPGGREREDLVQCGLIKLKFRLCAVDQNNAEITLLLQKSDYLTLASFGLWISDNIFIFFYQCVPRKPG